MVSSVIDVASTNGEMPVNKFQALQHQTVIEAEAPRFFTPTEVARMFRVSRMTVYRAIRDGDLPAVPMRGRWAVPALAIDTMERSALASLDAGDAAIDERDVRNFEGRPRPGANQSGAGSFSTQHVAGYGEDATATAGSAGSRGAS